MVGYKYPAHRFSSSSELQPRSLRTELHRENKRFKMFCSRWMLPFLAVYLLLKEISAAVLPFKFKDKREVNWLDQEVFSHLSDRTEADDLSVGDAGDMGRDVNHRPSHSETFIAPTEHLSVRRQYQNQNQFNRKASEKRRKVAPLDSIGSFQMSSSRNRKDQPDVYRENYRN